jgi:hypothetical protein
MPGDMADMGWRGWLSYSAFVLVLLAGWGWINSDDGDIWNYWIGTQPSKLSRGYCEALLARKNSSPPIAAPNSEAEEEYEDDLHRCVQQALIGDHISN